MFMSAAPRTLQSRVRVYARCCAAIGLFLFAPAQADADTRNDDCQMIAGPKHAALAIRNGETVLLDDRSEVRLQSIFAPRAPLATAPPTDRPGPNLVATGRGNQEEAGAFPSGIAWPAEHHAKRALQDLMVGRSVQLFFTTRARTDRYGTHTAQVFVIDGPERIWVQRRLIEQGHARVDPDSAPEPCTKKLLAAERSARRGRRGLWKRAPYAVRPAWKTRELLRYVRTFQIVEGRVKSVGDRRGRIYLNFGKRWSEDFTATVSRRARKRLERQGLDLKKLRGKRVHIRGWVEEWNGPAIRITKSSQIEVLTSRRSPRRRGANRLSRKSRPDTYDQSPRQRQTDPSLEARNGPPQQDVRSPRPQGTSGSSELTEI